MMYDREKSIVYAKEWCLKRNPKYAAFDDMGGDCTNFVSQCLYAGKIKMNYNKYGWFYDSLNYRSPAWTGVTELYNFGLNNKTDVGVRFKEIDLRQAKPADVIILINSAGVLYHSVIIYEVSYPSADNVLVCAHDDDSFMRPLSTYLYHDFKVLQVEN